MSKPLHIVMLHNRYQYVGGEDISTDTDVELLREYGHRVTLIEVHNDIIKTYSQFDKLKLFADTVWNFRIYNEMRSQFQKLKPDIVHVQNFFPLFSPSVHTAAKSLNIPTIQHLHNFRLGCLNGYLLRNDKICEICVGRNPWRGIGYGCYRNSAIASLAVWGMISLNRWRQTWWKDVDAFITPSNFAAKKLKEIGIRSDHLYVHSNLINPIDTGIVPLPQPKKPNFVFLGRLSTEKGVMLLLKAWAELNMSDWQLQIIGDGSEKSNLQHFVNELKLENVQFLGYLTAASLAITIQSATAIVVPSQWYETFGRVIVEAFAYGKPVIASDLGALSELVTSEHNGFLIPRNNISAWAEKLYWCGTNPEEIQIMGNNAYRTYQAFYTKSINYQQLMAIYNRVLIKN